MHFVLINIKDADIFSTSDCIIVCRACIKLIIGSIIIDNHIQSRVNKVFSFRVEIYSHCCVF